MDAIYYISVAIIMLGIPMLIILTIFLMARPHVINNKLKSPLSRKRILAIGLVSILITFSGFSSVMAATEPASVRAQQAAENKAAQELKTEQQNASKSVVKSLTTTENIPFESTNQNDNSLSSGKTQISVKGVNGVRTITYNVTYVNGKETNREQTSNIVTEQPINQVTLIGTYTAPTEPGSESEAANCTNGTYVNSSGNTVCRPETSSSAPSGATAKCGDGTYSFSQSKRGTCSHHSGVASWL